MLCNISVENATDVLLIWHAHRREGREPQPSFANVFDTDTVCLGESCKSLVCGSLIATSAESWL